MKKCLDCSKTVSTDKVLRCIKCANFKSAKLRMLSRRSYKGKNHPNYKHGRTLKRSKCIDCSQILGKYSFYNKNKRCYSCHNSFSKKGKKHPNYIDGRKLSPYPKEFNKKLRLKIKIRDKYKCQFCKLSENNHIKSVGYGLTVHHIDYNKNNCNNKNLITLCISCNVKANYKKVYYKKYFKAKNKQRDLLGVL